MQAAQAALAGHKAAEFALRAVEGGIDHYARSKNFEKLKEIAEASGVATKVLSPCQLSQPKAFSGNGRRLAKHTT